MIKKTIYISVSLLGVYILFEFFIEINTKKQLKKQIDRLISDTENNIKDYNDIFNEFSKVRSSEEMHILNSFSKTFNHSYDNLEKFIPRIKSYEMMRESINNSKIFNTSCINMFWYPYALRFVFSFTNSLFLTLYKLHYNVKFYNYEEKYIYYISNDKNKKNIVIFLGLGGIICPFRTIFNFFLERGYNIIIPIYGPSQASLQYNLNYNESEYYSKIALFLKNKNIKNITIISWSLGGILYKGFHNYICNFDLELFIEEVYLFEPLICIRSCMDTFFSHIRDYNNTLNIMNSVTSQEYSYHNIVFTYFMHTIIGFGTANSLGYFTNVETKDPSNIKYKRYLFLSSDDLIINHKLDKEYINNNYSSENIYYRKGYHGGWPYSRKLLPILNKLVNMESTNKC